MGTSWLYFRHYEIKPEEEYGENIIHFHNSGSFDINYLTSAFLASILKNFGILLPVYDEMEPPTSLVLDDLVDPHQVEFAAKKAIELLQSTPNPLVRKFYSTDEYEPIFNDRYIDEHHTVQGWNERIRSYLEKMIQLSNDGHFFIRCRN